jgi:hypothetical protein
MNRRDVLIGIGAAAAAVAAALPVLPAAAAELDDLEQWLQQYEAEWGWWEAAEMRSLMRVAAPGPGLAARFMRGDGRRTDAVMLARQAARFSPSLTAR